MQSRPISFRFPNLRSFFKKRQKASNTQPLDPSNARIENSIKIRTHWNPFRSLRNWGSNIKFRNRASTATQASNEVQVQKITLEEYYAWGNRQDTPPLTEREIARKQLLDEQAKKYPPQMQIMLRGLWKITGEPLEQYEIEIHPDDRHLYEERRKEELLLEELRVLQSRGQASEDNLDQIALLELKHKNQPHGISIKL